MVVRVNKFVRSNTEIERTIASNPDAGFWATIELLMEREWKNRTKEPQEDSMDLGGDFNTLFGPKAKRLKRKFLKASNRKAHYAASLFADDLDFIENVLTPSLLDEKLHKMGSGSEKPADRDLLKKLQQKGRDERHDAQLRRIKAREVEEMDRLKKLILNGRSPLDNCPPEIRSHPIFAFWKLVNKEIEKMNRARLDAFNRRYRRRKASTRKSSQRDTEASNEVSSQVSRIEVTPEPRGPLVVMEKSASSSRSSPITEFGIVLKYEDEDVKKLRDLTTVEELYQMADKIIGMPKENQST